VVLPPVLPDLTVEPIMLSSPFGKLIDKLKNDFLQEHHNHQPQWQECTTC
jgi:hypothetical protein